MQNEQIVNGYSIMNSQISSYELLTPEKEADLAARMRNGDEQAREELILSNLRLVKSIAGRYRNDHMTPMDIYQEGVKGLIVAADKYDPERGRFSTVATWWIKQAIMRAFADTGHTIRTPEHIFELRSKIKRTFHNLTQSLEREPSAEEVAKELKMPVEKIKEAMVHQPISLETPVAGDDGKEVPLIDMIEDEPDEFSDPYQTFERQDMTDTIKRVIGTLDDLEQQVINYRFGLYGGRPLTLKETGAKMGGSHEWVRKIEIRALRKLRNPVRTRMLKDYLYS